MFGNLAALWLPILVSAAAVWVASALMWMLVNHHDGDFKPLPNEVENDLVARLRAAAVRPAVYLIPHVANLGGDKKAQQAKFMEGPSGTLTIFPKPDGARMGRNMVLSVLVYLAVSFVMAYLGTLALPIRSSEATFTRVFQFMGTAGVLAYAFAMLPNGIWFAQSTRALVLHFVDGVIYGLAAGAVFAWLWPR